MVIAPAGTHPAYEMARIALPRQNDRTAAFTGALLLLLCAAALVLTLSTVQLPSIALHGLPLDWPHRAAWLAVDALIGLAIACGLLAFAQRRTERRPARRP